MEMKKLGDIFDLSGREKAGTESLPVMSITMKHGLIDTPEKAEKLITNTKTSNYKIAYKNDLVVGFPNKKIVIDFQKKYKQAIVNPTCEIWKFKKGISCDVNFIERYLKLNINHFIHSSKGRSAAERRRAFISIMVPYPPLSDQIRIATTLIRIEKLIKKRKKSIEALNEMLAGTFIKMFGNPFKNTKEWEKREIGEFGDIITGKTLKRNENNYYSQEFIEWVKTDNIITNETYLTPAVEYLSEEGFAKTRSVTPGALLVTCTSGSIEAIGRAAIANRPVSFNQQINAIQPNKQTNSLFLYWLFKLSKSHIQSHATKSTINFLSKKEFQKIRMISPPLDLQIEFAEIAEKVENLKIKYQQSLIELQNFYCSTSEYLFHGELDTNNVQMIPRIEKELDSNEDTITGGANLEAKKNLEFTDKDLVDLIKKYSGKVFSFRDIWIEIENSPNKRVISKKDVQNRILKLLESDCGDFQQVFELLTNPDDKYSSEKQIAFRSNL
ncbi:restriction endonuclease subunit S [Priestia aryabhattai]|uniref:restriction endonuclease subunit S n=1 Tax=Priestia aryabhattai TaxID=412384 RepID=UPI001CBDD375|nr:restriction endonuclease subunit S [Priestia aryabhattai]